MSKSSVVSIDAMSGDHGADVAVSAAVESLLRNDGLELILVGDEDKLTSLLGKHAFDQSRLQIQHASEVVEMSESPVEALRRKKDSSMRVAINLVEEGRAHACVSAGNTGALMATAKFVLKMLPGIDRPAILAELPAIGGSLDMLDLGANATCTPQQLFQFAVMGSIVTSSVRGVKNPRVALLNIGEEDTKGHDDVREAAALIADSSLNYVGFIEGNEIFSGRADVVVSDGFSGNVSLKTMEGTAAFIKQYLRDAYSYNWFSRLQALFSRSVLRRLAENLDSRRYNGASLVGLNGIVIKSHGGADAFAFRHAIDTALIEVQQQVPDKIGQLVQQETE